ncbi:hypothetical protein [Streptomyces sparsogenes]|uniref:hypothetical protein n=1 Tax=Streptomyces sparsogenes TaxID=67365 RepID=UPI0033D257A7
MNEQPEPQRSDSVIVDGLWLRIRDFSEDSGTLLSNGRWVCASDFVFVTKGLWRYEPKRECLDHGDPIECTCAARQGQDSARRERYAAAIQRKVIGEIRLTSILPEVYDAADAAMAVADEEHERIREAAEFHQRRYVEAQEENARLRAELAEAHATIGRVIALTGGRPGYHTITVKKLLRAVSGETND